MITFPFISLYNAGIAIQNLFAPESVKDFFEALVTLVFIAGVITACVYLWPALLGAFAAYPISYGLMVAAATLSTIALGELFLSLEMPFRMLMTWVGKHSVDFVTAVVNWSVKTNSTYDTSANPNGCGHCPNMTTVRPNPPSYEQATATSSQPTVPRPFSGDQYPRPESPRSSEFETTAVPFWLFSGDQYPRPESPRSSEFETTAVPL